MFTSPFPRTWRQRASLPAPCLGQPLFPKAKSAVFWKRCRSACCLRARNFLKCLIVGVWPLAKHSLLCRCLLFPNVWDRKEFICRPSPVEKAHARCCSPNLCSISKNGSNWTKLWTILKLFHFGLTVCSLD